MSDSLAERLKRLAGQQAGEQAAQDKLISLRERAYAFTAENARPEYERLQEHLMQRIKEVNPEIGGLPQFQFNRGSGMIQQGNCVSYIHFDMPVLNNPANQLLVSFAPHPNNLYIYERPQAIRYRLQATATKFLDSIVWAGDLGELTTAQLTDFILENLTSYYLRHKPR